MGNNYLIAAAVYQVANVVVSVFDSSVYLFPALVPHLFIKYRQL
jgi:hypothetical protein